MTTRLTFDIECYVNYFLIMFHDESKVVYCAEMHNNKPINREGFVPQTLDEMRANVLHLLSGTLSLTNGAPECITFNGIKYDVPMLTAFAHGATNQQLKMASDQIITTRMMPWIFERKYNVRLPKFNHIDLFEIPAGIHSLKLYAARLGAKKLQELPYRPEMIITDGMRENLYTYCINDNVNTWLLFRDQEKMVNLRRDMSVKYGMNLMSLSEPQIGHKVIVASAEQKLGRRLPKVTISDLEPEFKYTPAAWLGFTTDEGLDIFEKVKGATFAINQKTGTVLSPKELNRQITIGERKYKFGIGGLHSVGDGGSFYSDNNHKTYQIDVRSYYPRTIIGAQLHSPQMPPEVFFGENGAYEGLVIERDVAKARLAELKLQGIVDGAEVDALDAIVAGNKLSNNGFFGKLNSKYAANIYSPKTFADITLTGQLSLLMLIEQLELLGVQVLSANTDGITVRTPTTIQPQVDAMVKWWEDRTGYDMDYDHYKSIHYRDVNNYCTHYVDDKIKGIGIFCNKHVRHSPSNWIVRDAVFAYIKNGTSPYVTVEDCQDINLFLNVANVSGTAVKDGVIIGKVIRFYKSTETTTPIMPLKANKAGIFSKVPNSDNCRPLMDLPELLPDDIDYSYYTNETHRTLCKIHVLVEGSHRYLRYEDGSAGFVELTQDMFAEGVDGSLLSFTEFVSAIEIPKADVRKYKIKIEEAKKKK